MSSLQEPEFHVLYYLHVFTYLEILFSLFLIEMIWFIVSSKQDTSHLRLCMEAWISKLLNSRLIKNLKLDWILIFHQVRSYLWLRSGMTLI